MFFQEATPDTSAYMIAGYAVAFIVMALYVASIYVRSRNLKQDLTVLEEMEETEAAPVPPRRAVPPKNIPTQTISGNNNKSVKTVTKKSGTK